MNGNPVRLEHALQFFLESGDVGNMLKDVGTEHQINRVIRQRQMCAIVQNGVPVGAKVVGRRRDFDGDHAQPPIRQKTRLPARASANFQNCFPALKIRLQALDLVEANTL